jgi:hypothetical protein
MSKTRKNLIIQDETHKKLGEIARMTHRNLGAVVDWLVEEKHNELTRLPPPLYKITPAEK